MEEKFFDCRDLLGNACVLMDTCTVLSVVSPRHFLCRESAECHVAFLLTKRRLPYLAQHDLSQPAQHISRST
jgi:hypothetical protein